MAMFNWDAHPPLNAAGSQVQPTLTNYGHGRLMGPSGTGTLADAGSAFPASPQGSPAVAGGQTSQPGTMGPNGPIITTGQPFPGATAPVAGPGPAPMDRNEYLRNTPGYQFVQDEAMRGLNSRRAANGTLLNGGAVREALKLSAGIASTEFGNEFGRLRDITQLGQSGAAQLANYGSGYSGQNADLASQQANNTVGLGNAQGAGTIAGANAGNSAWSQFANTVGPTIGGVDWQRILNKNKPTSTLGAIPNNWTGPTTPNPNPNVLS